MNDAKTNILKKKIIAKFKKIDIAGYLLEDAIDLLKYLHFYKLKNMLKNIDDLLQYLIILDVQSTNQIKDLCQQNEKIAEFINKSTYYVSSKGRDHLDIDRNIVNIGNKGSIDYHLQSILMSSKGLLLLTLSEFCNGTNTRIYLSKIARQKQGYLK